MTRRSAVRAAGVVVALFAATACGSDDGSGPAALNWYVFDEPGGSFTQAAKSCSTDDYGIDVQVLPSDADQQREQLVRRLAADDSSSISSAWT